MNILPNIGLIRYTFHTKLNSLCVRYCTNYKAADASAFLNKLSDLLRLIDLEDLSQQLELFKHEAKLTVDYNWSDSFKTKVVQFVMGYDTVDFEPEIDPASDPIEISILPEEIENLKPFSRQLLYKSAVDGLSYNDLALIYDVDKITIYRWINDIFKTVQREVRPLQPQ